MYNISSPSTATEIMEHTSATPTGCKLNYRYHTVAHRGYVHL